ncbi:glycosyltransferase family 2 protein [Patescibacteria group bacterium]|nr:MAG: glycosyltransferase family 2 protein [Patescibacteria group bacterium]
MRLLSYTIIILGVLNVIRMTLYMLGSDIYTIKNTLRAKAVATKRRRYHPSVTIVVPVHNEGPIITRTMDSLAEIVYTPSKLQIIVINDGSTDQTARAVKNYIRRYVRKTGDTTRFKLVNQQNGGKADALNNAIRNHATGSLVMCLDGDSTIARDGIEKAVQYFRGNDTAALASNVNIMENQTLLGLVQRFEYLVSYQMKKAQTTYNLEYIIGGIGSMFRRSMLRRVEFYDTNTMTEDIDLTMKIITKGNRKHRVVYASDVITYTEPVLTLRALINQRFRWKYGRMQTFLKNHQLFFNRNKKYTRRLTWLILPFAVLQELMFLVEPIFVTFIIASSIMFHDPGIMLTACLLISTYMIFNIVSSEHLSTKERVRLSVMAPSMYFYMYVLAIAEYAALIKSIAKLKGLPDSIKEDRVTWVSPERSAAHV